MASSAGQNCRVYVHVVCVSGIKADTCMHACGTINSGVFHRPKLGMFLDRSEAKQNVVRVRV